MAGPLEKSAKKNQKRNACFISFVICYYCVIGPIHPFFLSLLSGAFFLYSRPVFPIHEPPSHRCPVTNPKRFAPIQASFSPPSSLSSSSSSLLRFVSANPSGAVFASTNGPFRHAVTYVTFHRRRPRRSAGDASSVIGAWVPSGRIRRTAPLWILFSSSAWTQAQCRQGAACRRQMHSG